MSEPARTPALVVPWSGRPTEHQLAAFCQEVILQTETDLLHLAMARTADQHVAEEIVQEAMMALCRALRAREVRGDVRAWLAAAVRHKAVDHVKRAATERAGLARLPAKAEAADPDPPPIEMVEDEREILRLVGTLPERQREAILLTVLEGQSPEEAAHIMGLVPQTVRNHRRLGLAKLRALLAETPAKGDGKA